MQRKLLVSATRFLMRSKMKKTFVIQVEYPDNDVIPSKEVMEVTQECIEHYMELHFGANIMDGDYDRIKVKEVTDGFSLVKRMREVQNNSPYKYLTYCNNIEELRRLESEVDEWLEKLE